MNEINEIKEAMNDYQRKVPYPEQEMYSCKMYLTDGYHFESPRKFSWRGTFSNQCAAWETHDIQTALSLFWKVHEYIKSDKDQ